MHVAGAEHAVVVHAAVSEASAAEQSSQLAQAYVVPALVWYSLPVQSPADVAVVHSWYVVPVAPQAVASVQLVDVVGFVSAQYVESASCAPLHDVQLAQAKLCPSLVW